MLKDLKEKQYTKGGKSWRERCNEALLEEMAKKGRYVMLSTLGSSTAAPVMSKQRYNFVLIDEAAQSAEPGHLIDIQLD